MIHFKNVDDVLNILRDVYTYRISRVLADNEED